jgi:hypothetical protein
MSLSLHVFSHHPDPIRHHLQETTANLKLPDFSIPPYRQRAFSQQSHHRSVVGQDADFTVKRRSYQGIRLPVEHSRSR